MTHRSSQVPTSFRSHRTAREEPEGGSAPPDEPSHHRANKWEFIWFTLHFDVYNHYIETDENLKTEALLLWWSEEVKGCALFQQRSWGSMDGPRRGSQNLPNHRLLPSIWTWLTDHYKEVKNIMKWEIWWCNMLMAKKRWSDIGNQNDR